MQKLDIEFEFFSSIIVLAKKQKHILGRVPPMTENEKELISIIRNSDAPEKVAEYVLNLFLDYLHTRVPSQETPSADLRESV